MKKLMIIFILVLIPFAVSAQVRDKLLTIHAVTNTGESMRYNALTVTHTDYQLSYGSLQFDAEGTCQVKVYAGNHTISVQRPGYEPVEETVLVDKDTEITVTLKEKVRKPFALQTKKSHDAFTGKNSIHITWNKQEPVFFDDFESYEPFSLSFAPWIGIDADREAAAPLIGEYPNRGSMQYAQVINPLEVDPTWWYEYGVLRPYSGKQYIGFTRTMTGVANDDWLISPVLSIGHDNILSFLAKAADLNPERFQVYVTTKTENPKQEDFVQISEGNYESVNYEYWYEKVYSLKEYEGKDIRFAIRYIGEYNTQRTFMLMIDDVFVGQSDDYSDVNPNEEFAVYLDGELIGTTVEKSFTLENVTMGHHTIGVKARYIASETEITETEVGFNADDYHAVTFRATTNSVLSAAGVPLGIVNTTTMNSESVPFSEDCTIVVPSMEKGSYLVSVESDAFEKFEKSITINGDTTIAVELSDRVITPYNITIDTREAEDGSIAATVKWNQQLSFSDSFEDYDDFAVGEFGGWLSIDRDQMPVYPIGLGSATNIVSFPGSGEAGKPQPLAPIVFNPWNTKPAMLPTDKAVAAPTGDKTIAFFSPQRQRADKWLIAPEMDIRDNYIVEFTGKAYSTYPESMEICVSTTGTEPEDFTAVAVIDELETGSWMRYQADLSEYAGQKARVALHYVSYDAFFAQIDDFTIGDKDGETVSIDFGNVVKFQIFVDGEIVAETDKATAELQNLTEGKHVLAIKAVYKSGESELIEKEFDVVSTGIETVVLASRPAGAAFNLLGQRLSSRRTKGVIIENGRKVILK